MVCKLALFYSSQLETLMRVCVEDLPLSKLRRLAARHSRTSAVCRDFARIGTGGAYVSNLYRDLFRKLGQQSSVQPTMIKLPIRTRKGKFIYVDWPVIAPHELVASFVSMDCWKKMLVGDVDVDCFWTQLLQ